MADTKNIITSIFSVGKVKGTVSQTFLSLKNRNFKLYFWGQLVSVTGNWLTNVALTLLVLKITGSGLAVGVLAAFQYGPILLLSMWGGVIADRVDKRKMLILTQSLEMLQSVGLAIMAFMPHPSMSGLYALALIGGILLSFDNPLRRSFVSEMVPRDHMANAVVLNSTVINISRIFGPTLAGILVVSVGYGWCFTVDALSYLAVIISLLAMKPGELYREKGLSKLTGHVREGFTYIMSMPILWISFAMLAFIGTLSYNFSVTLPLFVTNTLHKSNVEFTILYSIFSFGAVVSSLVVAHRGMVKIRHVIYGAGTLGIAMVLLSIATRVDEAFLVAFLVGVTSILYTTSTTAIIQIQTKPEVRGRVLALQSMLMMGTTPIGAPFLGWLADIYGARTPLIFGGVVALVTATLGYLAVRQFIDKKGMVYKSA